MSTIDEQRIRRLLDAGQALMSDLELDGVLDRVLSAARDLTGAPHAMIGVLDESRASFSRFVGSDAGGPPQGRGVLDAPIVIRGRLWGHLYLLHANDSEFADADAETIAVLSGWAAAAIDSASLYAMSERRRTELEHAVRELEATRDVLLAIGASSSLAQVLELIVKRGRALIDAHTVVILLREHDELVVAASAGPAIDIGVLSHEHGPSPPDSDAERGVGQLLVPMLHRGQSIGMLAAAQAPDAGRGFSDEDHQLLVLFAATAATAVAMARVAEADRLRSSLKIAEAERRRWARELHDETLQGLGAMRLQLGTALKRGATGADADGVVHDVLHAIDREIDNLRAIITDLRPAALDELGLSPALEALVERRARDGLAISHELVLPDPTAGSARLDPELEIAIYRIVQEGLTNIVKHARATTVRLTVATTEDRVVIELVDDGIGFDPSTPKTGFGLAGIQERINLVGGKLELDSGETGTLLRVNLRGTVPNDAAAGS
jgi:signal transduction histidine kinase